MKTPAAGGFQVVSWRESRTDPSCRFRVLFVSYRVHLRRRKKQHDEGDVPLFV